MYDLNKNNYITREEFKFILNMMVGSNITSDQLESIADRTITEADLDKDGKISFEEFCRAMERTGKAFAHNSIISKLIFTSNSLIFRHRAKNVNSFCRLIKLSYLSSL